MARSYRRDGSGRFAAGKAKGDAASTVQQNKAEHKRQQRNERDALSGGRLGDRKAKRLNRNKTIGKAATNKRMKAALAAARRRFT